VFFILKIKQRVRLREEDLTSMPGLVPADELLSFAPPKERIQRKGGASPRVKRQRQRQNLKAKSKKQKARQIVLRRMAVALLGFGVGFRISA
jgi:hypothetical protein